MNMKSPYYSLCTTLEGDLKGVKKELASLPRGFAGLIASRIRDLASEGSSLDRSSTLQNIIASLEKIRAKAESALDTLNSSAQGSEESDWQERLVDIVLEVDELAVEAKEKTDPLGQAVKDTALDRINSTKLPKKLDLKIEETHDDSKQDVLKALNKLLQQGLLSEQEYEEKLKRIS